MSNGEKKYFLWKLKETIKVLFNLELLDEVAKEEEQKALDRRNAAGQTQQDQQEQES